MRLKILAFILILATAGYSGAFDDRYPSARSAGMANAFTAVANDAWAAFYNPAGLAQISNYQAGLAYQRPFGLSFFNSVFGAAVMPLPGEYGTVSLTFESFGVKYKGTTLSNETTATLSHGFYLLNDIHSSLSIGYNLKLYHMSLGTSVDGAELGSAATVGLDVGMMASIYKRTWLGLFIYNLNNPKLGVETAEELPRRVVVGAAYRPYTGLTTSISVDQSVGAEMQVEAGFEFQLVEMLALRLGASSNPNRITAGLGINFENFQLDYAFRSHPVLAETHMFSLLYSW